MGSGEELVRILSPFCDALRKMETKLKCPVCKSLLDEPKLLPCDHIFCQNCMPTVDGKKPRCPVCDKYHPKDARGSSYVKEMLKVFNKMDGAIFDISKSIMSDKPPTVEENEIQAIPPDLVGRNSLLISSKSCKKDEANISRSAMSNICTENLTGGRGDAMSNICTENLSGERSETDDRSCAPDLSTTSSSCEIIETRTIGSGANSSFKKEKIEIKGAMSGNRKYIDGAVKGDERGNTDNRSCAPDMSTASSSCEIIETRTIGSCAESSFKKEEFQIKGGISGSTSYLAGAAKSAKRKREENSTIGSDKRLKRHNLANCLIGTNQQEIKSRCTPINLFDDECAFCHTFRTTKLYGPIVCYLNGILVKPEEEGQEKVIYVHEKCVDWAPTVYYSGDNVMNLEEEIERGEKLLCSKCGIKGAVLGCSYGPCRRSYHATCALEIDCTWDSAHFKMLCPAHKDEKLDNLIPDV